MKILFSSRFLNSPRGGAERSALALIRMLAEQHQLFVFSIANKLFRAEPWKEKFPLFEYKFPPLLQKRILPGELREFIIEALSKSYLNDLCKDLKPDLIISQANILLPNLYCSKKIMLIVDYGSSISIKARSGILLRVANCIFAARRRSFLRGFDFIINYSHYMADLFASYNIKSEVLPPFIDLGSCLASGARDTRYITFLQPIFSKGVQIISEIAKRMPEKEFLIVGRISETTKELFNGLKNINFCGWSSDVKEVYRVTKIILMPSIWQEPFGMVPIEAGINSIPSIVSKVGGLPEAVGNSGILIDSPWNIEAWVKAINFVTEENTYRIYQERARINAEKYNSDIVFNNFKNLIAKNLNISL